MNTPLLHEPSACRTRPRRGVTLIELTVAMAAASIVVGIILAGYAAAFGTFARHARDAALVREMVLAKKRLDAAVAHVETARKLGANGVEFTRPGDSVQHTLVLRDDSLVLDHQTVARGVVRFSWECISASAGHGLGVVLWEAGFRDSRWLGGSSQTGAE